MHYGPKMVQDSIEFSIDAGNVKSYPGSGTTITTLNGIANNCTAGGNVTIPTGPARFKTNATAATHDTAYYIITTDHVQIADNLDWSLETWVKSSTGASYQGLSGRGATNNWWTLYITDATNWQIRYRDGGASYMSSTDENSANIQSWTHIVTTCDESGNIIHYVNGTKAGDTLVSTNTALDVDRVMGGYVSGGNHHPLRGEMGLYNLYSKTLSAAEVLQNYNATRGRFE